MRQTPVLVVGAGPAGLILSIELTLHGIPHIIVEASTSRSPWSRALVLHSRTLELLSRHDGLVEKLLPLGRMNMAVRMFANKSLMFEFDVKDFEMKDTRFATPLLISQAETERVLEAHLEEKGVNIERGVKAEKIEKDDEGVTVTVVDPQGNQSQIRCQYLVGCDGAHSIVRKSCDLAFTGAAYPQDFILADVRLSWSLKNNLSTFMGPYGFMAFFPMKDNVWRVLASRVHERESDTEPTLADFQESIKHLVPNDANVVFWDEPPLWMSRFRLHHRIVDSYRDKRCFLAGDAAHIHSPAGGQGMNTGMQDSVNLAWKLAAVIRKERDDTFLDTYNTERHRIGEHLLKETDRAFELMATSSPIYLWFRNYIIPWILPLINLSAAARENRFRFVSELNVRYRHSPIVGQGSRWRSATIKGGNRLPDSKLIGQEGEIYLHSLTKTPTYHCLLFSGTGTKPLEASNLRGIAEDLKTDHKMTFHLIIDTTAPTKDTFNDELGVVHALLDMKVGGFVLVRPDGYIEFLGLMGDLPELKTWIQKQSSSVVNE